MFVQLSKNYNFVNRVELLDVNIIFANIRSPDRRESTVSLQDLEPCLSTELNGSRIIPRLFWHGNSVSVSNDVIPDSNQFQASPKGGNVLWRSS